MALVAAGCGADGSKGTTARRGSEGESCVKTDDCEAPLKCLQNVCQGPVDAVTPSDVSTEDAVAPEDVPMAEDEGPELPGPANLDIVAEVLMDFLQPEDLPPPPVPGPKPELPNDILNPVGDCEGVGIASEWAGTFNGEVSYTTTLAIPGAPSQGTLPVLGTLEFSVQCIEKKLVVLGKMDGTALAQYPFVLEILGSFNPETGQLTASMKNGKVTLFDLGGGITIAALFEGTFKGDLTPPDAFEGTWDGYSTGTEPAGIPGSATGLGTWNAAPK